MRSDERFVLYICAVLTLLQSIALFNLRHNVTILQNEKEKAMVHIVKDIDSGIETLVITKSDKNTLNNAKRIIKGLAKVYPEWEPVWKAMKEGKLAIPSPKKAEEGEETKTSANTANTASTTGKGKS